MNQENKDPSLGEQAGKEGAADCSSKDDLKVSEKKAAVKKICPMMFAASFQRPCLKNECAWWVIGNADADGKCAIAKIVDVLNNLFVTADR
jgi:hypothetical protein